jgi:biofilm PGA synthesis N-glycosyltransferase PgaC
LLQFIFWFCVLCILYTFFGYALLIGLAARLFPQPNQQGKELPPVTLLIAAYNEEDILAEKLDNSLSLDYPRERLRLVVAADGSADNTCSISESYASQGVVTYFQPERQGKVAAVNRVMPLLTDPIIIFTDANSMLSPASLRKLVRHFADPAVAAVAGEKQVQGGGEGLYWRYESFLKRSDSAISSVMGAAGELFAVRRALFDPPEVDSIIEDFIISMRLVQAGWRVIYEPNAVAWEAPLHTLHGEWQRRTRIAAGGIQAIRRLSGLLAWPWNRITWQYVSHRVLRWAVTPVLLPLVLVVNLALWSIPIYRLLALTQIGFYLLATIGFWQARAGKRSGVVYAAFFFVFTNLAALVGMGRGVTGRQPVTWAKTR